MSNWITQRSNRLREFFGLTPETELLSPQQGLAFDFSEAIEAHLSQFNFEWHIIPAEEAVSVEEDDYRERLYPTIKIDPQPRDYRRTSSYRAVIGGHRRYQGRIVAIETTIKPRYLPGNRQFYGSPYGFDERADPLGPYLSRATFLSSSHQLIGTRYGHNYTSLHHLLHSIEEDWRAQNLLPKGYRLTVCPPVMFNLIGAVFHQEWSMTESLELGFYTDEHDNAKCFVVGSNGPNDFSYIREIATDSDWTLLGFRTALLPE